jgi:hypothetical protein
VHDVALPFVRSDDLSEWIEDPLLVLLMLTSSVFLQPNVRSSLAFSNSLHWKSRSDVEWPVDIESEIFVESFICNLCSIFNIDYLPLLVLSAVLLVDLNKLSFNILST